MPILVTAPLMVTLAREEQLENARSLISVTPTGIVTFGIHYKFVGYLELPSLARQHNYREETRKGVAVEYVPNALPA